MYNIIHIGGATARPAWTRARTWLLSCGRTLWQIKGLDNYGLILLNFCYGRSWELVDHNYGILFLFFFDLELVDHDKSCFDF
jgi:hypothetical protein